MPGAASRLPVPNRYNLSGAQSQKQVALILIQELSLKIYPISLPFALTNRAIGARLELSNYTVQWHLIRIFDKLQAYNRTEAVIRALTMGVLQGTLSGTSEYVVFQN